MFIDDRSFNKGMVYNVKSEKKYYIYKEKKKVIINPKSISFVFEEFLLDNYLDKKNDYLKSLQNNVKWSHPNGVCHYILEVKKNEKMKYLVLEPIYLNENGIPL